MKITGIRIRKILNNDRPMKAFLSITFDDQFVIHDVKIVYANGRLLVVMPGKQMPDGSFRDVAHPLNQEFRTEMEEAVLAAYREALESGLDLVDGGSSSFEV